MNVNDYLLFAQDTWRARSNLTLTYGLRWEIDGAPASATPGQPPYTLHGIFDSNPLALVPGALWHTRLGNFAPRIGAAYQINPKTVLRGGFGLFSDLGYGDVGLTAFGFPYSRHEFLSFPPGSAFDLANPILRPPPFSTTINSNVIQVSAVDPHLRIPFTEQWNAAVERQLGTKQTLSATYVGSAGSRLLREDRPYPSRDSEPRQRIGLHHVERRRLNLQRVTSAVPAAYVAWPAGACVLQPALNQGIWVPRMQEIFARRV